MNGIESIAAERQRQIDEEGWTPKHDDQHTKGEIARAAASYASHAAAFFAVNPSLDVYRIVPASVVQWPWDRKWWKPKDRRSDLVRAGALIAAEIDRIDRLEKSTGGTE